MQGLLAARGGAGALPTFAAAGMAGAAGSIALYPVGLPACSVQCMTQRWQERVPADTRRLRTL